MTENIHTIRKRSGHMEIFDPEKIRRAITRAFASTGESVTDAQLNDMTGWITAQLQEGSEVEQIQDLAEQALMENGFYKTAKAYILYRQTHARMREIVNRLTELAQDPTLAGLLTQVQEDFPQSEYSLDRLQIKAAELIRPDQSAKERLRFLERAAAELTSRNAPKWEDIAARILNHELEAEISGNEQA
ncbi:ATP cone domain-containing protein, partial [Faecalibaculum rodentium]